MAGANCFAAFKGSTPALRHGEGRESDPLLEIRSSSCVNSASKTVNLSRQCKHCPFSALGVGTFQSREVSDGIPKSSKTACWPRPGGTSSHVLHNQVQVAPRTIR